jgi:hypothetical protein
MDYSQVTLAAARQHRLVALNNPRQRDFYFTGRFRRTLAVLGLAPN